MRVPVPIAITLCVVAILLTWWIGTRKMDFLTPPETIAPVSIQGKQSIVDPATSGKRVEETQTVRERSSEQSEPVELETFSDQAAMGPGHLIELAKNMEKAKWPHLALLAWERVIDSTSPSKQELNEAKSAIKRLKEDPAANDRVILPSEPYTITLNAGTANRASAEVEAELKSAAGVIETTSAGILNVKVQVAAGQDPSDSTDFVPIAVWITGPDESSRSSELISFTMGPGKETHQEIGAALAKLLREVVLPPLPNLQNRRRNRI